MTSFWCLSCDLEHISHLCLVFLLLTFKRLMFADLESTSIAFSSDLDEIFITKTQTLAIIKNFRKSLEESFTHINATQVFDKSLLTAIFSLNLLCFY